MPINIEQLDASASEENVTLLLGRNILLKIVEDLDSKSLLKDPLVEKLISASDLCGERVVRAMDNLLKSDVLHEPPLSWTSQSKPLIRWGVDFFENIPSSTITAETKTAFQTRNYEVSFLNAAATLSHLEPGRLAKSGLVKRDRKLQELGQEVKGLTGLDMLEPTVVIFCPHCKWILSIGEFKGPLKCGNCGKEASRSQGKRIPVHRVSHPIRRVWGAGLWFEAYVARLFRTLGWKTWLKVYIMGSSGVSHEIDVLAIKGGNIAVTECKTGRVSRNDVFNFLTKTQDLKVHLGLIALLGELPEAETKDFVKKNRVLSLMEGMSKMKEDQIVDRMKQLLAS